MALYDDLRPGLYRITMLYKFLPEHWRVAILRGHDRVLRLTLRVLPFRPGPLPRLPERYIRRVAMKVAAGGGDSHPALIQHAVGTRFAANLVSSKDLIFDWSWAYLIAIRGHFKLPSASRPPGAPAPHGSVLTIVIDARTRRGEDFGLSNHYPDLADLGPVTTDYRR